MSQAERRRIPTSTDSVSKARLPVSPGPIQESDPEVIDFMMGLYVWTHIDTSEYMAIVSVDPASSTH